MGDRVSIQFKNGEEKSVVFFSHWGGMEFVRVAREYAENLTVRSSGRSLPLDRLEPSTVMVDFIRHLVTEVDILHEVSSDYYLGVDENDGDNSDNGHHIIKLPYPPASSGRSA